MLHLKIHHGAEGKDVKIISKYYKTNKKYYETNQVVKREKNKNEEQMQVQSVYNVILIIINKKLFYLNTTYVFS